MIPNFDFIKNENGNVISADDANVVFTAIQVVTAALIAAQIKSPMLPSDFTGENQIPAGPISNSLIYIDASGNVNVIPLAAFDASVAAAASSAGAAAGSASSASSSASAANVSALAAAASALAAAASASEVANFTSQTGITAAGTSQATATALTASDNFTLFEVTSVAVGTGVKLPASAASRRVMITNRSSNALEVYANASGTIDGASGISSQYIAPGQTILFAAKDGADNWVSNNQVTQAGALVFSNHTGEKARISTDGNFLIGTGIDHGYKLAVAGTCYFNGVEHDVKSVNGVGSIRVIYNSVSNPSISSNSNVAGSSMQGVTFSGGSIVVGGYLTGTWKNISGDTIPNGAAGEMLRIF